MPSRNSARTSRLVRIEVQNVMRPKLFNQRTTFWAVGCPEPPVKVTARPSALSRTAISRASEPWPLTRVTARPQFFSSIAVAKAFALWNPDYKDVSHISHVHSMGNHQNPWLTSWSNRQTLLLGTKAWDTSRVSLAVSSGSKERDPRCLTRSPHVRVENSAYIPFSKAQDGPEKSFVSACGTQHGTCTSTSGVRRHDLQPP